VTNVDGTNYLNAVSCASSSLCVAVDFVGNVVTSSTPTGGAAAWTVTHVDDFFMPLSGVSCPSSGLCVAVDISGNVVTSSNPTGGAAAWTVTHVDGTNFLSGVSCTGSGLCVAVDYLGNVVTSSNPIGGAGAWTVTPVDGGNILLGVSCPSSGLCVAVDLSGNVVTSSNPTGGAAAWTVTNVDGSGGGLYGVSCASSGLCVAVDAFGNVVTSSNPTGGAAAWTVTHVDTIPLLGVSCPSSGLCVAVDFVGNVVTSSNPTGGASAWTVTNVDGTNYLAGVSCPSSGLCVAVDLSGNVVTSSNPTAGAAAWTVTLVDGNDFTSRYPTQAGSVSCPSNGLCVAVDNSGHVVTGTGAMAVLPAMSNGAYGGYTTAATIQNIGTGSATVRIDYFDQNGAPVGSGDSISSLPVNASWTVRQDNGNSFPSSGGDAAQAGSAVVYSSQPIASFVNEFAPGNVGDATSYSGVQVPSGVGTTLYAPTIVNNAYGGYTTGIGLLNEGSSPTNVTITYRDGSGAIVKTQPVTALAAHAYQALFSGDTTLALPSGFAGTATITSTAGQPLGAIVNEVGPGGQFSSYDAVPSGSTLLNVPVALNNAFGGYYTGMGIQNTSASAGSVSVTYYDASGTATPKTFSIAANGSLGVYQGSATDGPAAGAYTAVIQSSTVALAAIVNEVAPSSTSAKQSTSYNAFGAGSATLHLPLVENAGSDPWNTGEGIMNTGTASTTVTVTYYSTGTGAAVGTLQTQTLAPHAFWGLYQPTGGLPSGTRATAVVTTSSGGQVAVICNESSATTFMSYGGQ
jgi:hypothetical protein